MSKTKCSKCGNKKWKRKDEDNFICVKCRQKERKAKKGETMTEQVYDRYYDTAGNYHWTGVCSGNHIERGEGMTEEKTKGILAQIKYEHTSNSGTKDSTAKACDTAIQSLEAWDKVIKEVTERTVAFIPKSLEENETYESAFHDGVNYVMDIIKEYLGEVEDLCEVEE